MSRILNVHRVELPCSADNFGPFLDALGSQTDAIWPRHRWPPMSLPEGLRLGATGNHGPVRYVVEAYQPGVLVQFRFTQPVGFCGSHTFEVMPTGGTCCLEHRVEMTTKGWAILGWPLIFGPLHDALARDAGVLAGRAAGAARPDAIWSAYVRTLRFLGRAW